MPVLLVEDEDAGTHDLPEKTPSLAHVGSDIFRHLAAGKASTCFSHPWNEQS